MLRGGVRHPLREDPDLTLGIRRREATITGRRHFEVSDLGSGALCAFVQGVDVIHIDVNEGRRMYP